MKTARFVRILTFCVILLTVFACLAVGVSAEEAPAPETGEAEAAPDSTGTKAVAAAAVVGLGAVAGAIAMGLTISRSVDSMARQPEASGRINSAMMLGLVFIETAIIYALIVAILIIFVL